MRIGRDTAHTLALAALILAAFGWREASFDRIEAKLNDIRATLSEHGEMLTALEAGQKAILAILSEQAKC